MTVVHAVPAAHHEIGSGRAKFCSDRSFDFLKFIPLKTMICWWDDGVSYLSKMNWTSKICDLSQSMFVKASAGLFVLHFFNDLMLALSPKAPLVFFRVSSPQNKHPSHMCARTARPTSTSEIKELRLILEMKSDRSYL